MRFFYLITILFFLFNSTLLGKNVEHLDNGLDFFWISTPDISDSIAVLRISPLKYSLSISIAEDLQNKTFTAANWAKSENYLAVINAGMYRNDKPLLSSAYLRRNDTVLNSYIHPKYGSFILFDPINSSLPLVKIVEIDDTNWRDELKNYRTVLQTYRMLTKNGENTWPENGTKSSIVAFGLDKKGNVLFLHSKQAFTCFEFTKNVQAANISIMQMVYIEGGGKASMYISTKNKELSLQGVSSRIFFDLQSNLLLPNVLGIRKRIK